MTDLNAQNSNQIIHFVDQGHKPMLLKSIIKTDPSYSLLVFARTKQGANRIIEFLERNSIRAHAIHGGKSKSACDKALKSFRDGRAQVLVINDSAAKDYIMPPVTHVIHYDMPYNPTTYLERIQSGTTKDPLKDKLHIITFCDAIEREFLKTLEQGIKIKLTIDENHPFHGLKFRAKQKSKNDYELHSKSGHKAKRRNSDGSINDNYSKPKNNTKRAVKRGYQDPRYSKQVARQDEEIVDFREEKPARRDDSKKSTFSDSRFKPSFTKPTKKSSKPKK